MSAWQSCGRRLRECIDDVCRSMGECAWPPEMPVRLDTGGKRGEVADSVSSEVMAASPLGNLVEELRAHDLMIQIRKRLKDPGDDTDPEEP